MTYTSAASFRTALEQRLLNNAAATGVSIDRLRRRVMFERIVTRLDLAEPGRWVLKGGMALEVRLRDQARVTKDIDLGLRDELQGLTDLQDRITDALTLDPDNDWFEFLVTNPRILGADSAGVPTWRVSIETRLAGRPFGSLSLDASPRAQELTATERLMLPNPLGFAGIPDRSIETIDVNRHAAEKLHAISRTYGDRENSRVRDLIDLVILDDHGLIDPNQLGHHVRAVWQERDGEPPPSTLPPLPASWPKRYEQDAAKLNLDTDFSAAISILGRLWTIATR